MFAHLPLLTPQLGLYRLPRSPERFEAYVKLLTGPGDTLALPLAAINPMAKAHVVKTLEQFLELDAETLAAEAVVQANAHLELPTLINVGLVVVDDVAGGWTNRYLTETSARFESLELRHGFATTLLWASEAPTPEGVTQGVLAACYRTFQLLRCAPPRTLRQLLAQEGQAAAFAGAHAPKLDTDELAYTRAVIAPQPGTTSFPTAFACLYGDDAARSVGYVPLGLSADAGYALALHDAYAHSEAEAGSSSIAS